jgi:DNA-binding transcriptional MerR regulator
METKRYRIGELSKLLGVSKSSLIYWEKNQDIPPAKRERTLLRTRYWDAAGAREVAEFRYFRGNHPRV